MFKIFRKTLKLYSPCDGYAQDISKSKDQVFKSKVMGDGFLVKPQSKEILSPISGEVVSIFPTKHAYGIRTKEGVEVIVHIGIDTALLKKNTIISDLRISSFVTEGEILAVADFNEIESQNFITDVMVIIVNAKNYKIALTNYETWIEAGDVIVELI